LQAWDTTKALQIGLILNTHWLKRFGSSTVYLDVVSQDGGACTTTCSILARIYDVFWQRQKKIVVRGKSHTFTMSSYKFCQKVEIASR